MIPVWSLTHFGHDLLILGQVGFAPSPGTCSRAFWTTWQPIHLQGQAENVTITSTWGRASDSWLPCSKNFVSHNYRIRPSLVEGPVDKFHWKRLPFSPSEALSSFCWMNRDPCWSVQINHHSFKSNSSYLYRFILKSSIMAFLIFSSW